MGCNMIQASLYTHISDFIKKFVLPVFLVLCLCIGVNNGLRYLLVDDSAEYDRIMMHELYGQKRNIDILFLGSSHCYRTFDTKITDIGFEANTFNAGSSSETIDGSYALLKEVEKSNNVKEVYVELYYALMGNDFDKRTDGVSTFIISDYMRPSLNRTDYLLHAVNEECWPIGFIYARREPYTLLMPNKIADIVSKKHTEKYRNYDYVCNEEEYYSGKGFVANEHVFEENDLDMSRIKPIPNKVLSYDDCKYMKKIRDYCKKNNVKLKFFVTMEPRVTIDSIGNYSCYDEQVKKYSDELGVPFYDFNLCKKAYYDTKNKRFFKDQDHLNLAGADKFSKLFCDVFTGRISITDVLYSNYTEKEMAE